VDYDLATQWMLWFFGTCFGGALLGALVGRFTSFETGIGVALLLMGAVSLSYVPRFWIAHDDFLHHPLRAEGVVVAVEDRATNADGSITTPVAVVEYEAVSGDTRRVDSRAASGFRAGDAVVVIPDALERGGARVGTVRQMQGAAIASLLFGTFPFSAGLFFLASALLGWRESRLDLRERQRRAERTATPSRVTPFANALLFGSFVPVVWAGTRENPDVLRTVLTTFGLVSIALWAHVADGIRLRRDPRWTMGLAVIALNFGVWCVALWGLSGEVSRGW
jgi:hypothetical protein